MFKNLIMKTMSPSIRKTMALNFIKKKWRIMPNQMFMMNISNLLFGL